MSDSALAPAPSRRWPLARVLALLLAMATLGLVIDLRLEHVDVLREDWVPWVPIAYSAVVTILSVPLVWIWSRRMRRIMLVIYLLGFGVGGWGFWEHNQGKPLHAFTQSLYAWYEPIRHGDEPPVWAPLTFAGIGLLGVLSTMERFDKD